MGKMTAVENKNKEVNRLAADECCNFSCCRAVLSVYCIICKAEIQQEEEKQLSRESEISKFKEALKETRVRGIVFRVIPRDDFSLQPSSFSRGMFGRRDGKRRQ
jgi:hypothetical protein